MGATDIILLLLLCRHHHPIATIYYLLLSVGSQTPFSLHTSSVTSVLLILRVLTLRCWN
jgi:hypothetical protein